MALFLTLQTAVFSILTGCPQRITKLYKICKPVKLLWIEEHPSAYIIKMLQKLCLQWDDFQDNIKTAFGKLREVNDFADVTLACEDGQQVEAHKVILASSSPFFQKLLKLFQSYLEVGARWAPRLLVDNIPQITIFASREKIFASKNFASKKSLPS